MCDIKYDNGAMNGIIKSVLNVDKNIFSYKYHNHTVIMTTILWLIRTYNIIIDNKDCESKFQLNFIQMQIDNQGKNRQKISNYLDKNKNCA